jgi:hypothetical protein
MTCAYCNEGPVICEESHGGTSGRFREEWECQHCGAAGTVKGVAEQPESEWTKTGMVFES